MASEQIFRVEYLGNGTLKGGIWVSLSRSFHNSSVFCDWSGQLRVMGIVECRIGNVITPARAGCLIAAFSTSYKWNSTMEKTQTLFFNIIFWHSDDGAFNMNPVNMDMKRNGHTFILWCQLYDSNLVKLFYS